MIEFDLSALQQQDVAETETISDATAGCVAVITMLTNSAILPDVEAAGSLTFMACGTDGAYARTLPLRDIMGQKSSDFSVMLPCLAKLGSHT